MSIVFILCGKLVKKLNRGPEHSSFPMSRLLKNEIVISLELSFHPPFSFFSSGRESGDNLTVGE
jgi:hypothetical protein